ncbi:MAG: putative GTP-binding protein ryh1 [Streblomastix strix]|uniref:Putative GTP-binding protein ryh1 n=1 Tax=Streblomastix strix TaxID=222440 RepID=A0A5J4WYM3_9EUKA|nr:MAG: putative GTP-binding protein ryh1 [Streblomastix strix]
MQQGRQFKIVFLGDLCVGKTSLIARFMYDTFDSTYQPTIGIDFLAKTVSIDNRPVKLHLWDTAGQERFRALIPSYLRDSSAAVVLFDVTNRQSFDNLSRWIDEVRDVRGDEVLITIVGSKSDLVEYRAVISKEGEEKARQLNCLYMEISSKTGANIRNLFFLITKSLLNYYNQGSQGSIYDQIESEKQSSSGQSNDNSTERDESKKKQQQTNISKQVNDQKEQTNSGIRQRSKNEDLEYKTVGPQSNAININARDRNENGFMTQIKNCGCT